MTRLSAVPAPALRDGVYVRVSAVMGRTDERFLSPEIQREAIDRARGRGPVSRVVAQWDDIDVSTARVKAENRPGLQAALAAARDGSIDRLWFLTLDRFDRDTAALRAFDEIAGAGVELWTEAGRIDVESAEGYLSTTMQLAIARYQRDRIGKAWKQTHEHRVERGLPHSGKPRFGYVYDPAARIHVPDPVTGPALAECYRRYVDGAPLLTLVRWLNGSGVTTTTGGPWVYATLRRVLDSGFAAGLMLWHGDLVPASHEPLIDGELWAAYCASRDVRRRQVNTERSQYVLSGLVRCGHCGAAMAAGRYGSQRKARYTCRRGLETGEHAGGNVAATVVEGAVLTWLRDVADEVEAAVDLTARSGSRRARHAEDAQELEKRAAALDMQMQALVRHLASGRLLEAEFDAAAAGIRAEQQQLAERAAAERTAAAAPTVVDPQRAARDLLALWPDLPVAGRREVLRRLIDRVVVTTGRPRATVAVVPSWDA